MKAVVPAAASGSAPLCESFSNESQQASESEVTLSDKNSKNAVSYM
jgi:hypothetical protein